MKIMNALIKELVSVRLNWLHVLLLPVAIITGAIRNSLVLKGVNDILGEFSCHGYSIATLHKFIYTNILWSICITSTSWFYFATYSTL